MFSTETEAAVIYQRLEDMGHKTDRAKVLFLLHTYCKGYVNSNLWVLDKMHAYVTEFEAKKYKGARDGVIGMIEILKHLRYNEYDIAGLCSEEEIDALLAHFEGVLGLEEHCRVVYYKDVFRERAYNIISLFEYLLQNGRAKECLKALVYVVLCRQGSLYADPAEKHDIVWILFDIILWNSQYRNLKKSGCYDFVSMARDIFFYKMKKDARYRMERMPLLLHSLLVVFKGKPKFKGVDLPVKSMSLDDRMAYLYAVAECDEDARMEIEHVKAEKSKAKVASKRFKVASKDFERLERMKHNIAVIKSK